MWLKTCFLSLCLSLTSCGYHFGSTPLDEYRTLSIPYVKGDERGALTSVLIQTLNEVTPYQYRTEGGDLLLEVEILNVKSDHIGYQYPTNTADGIVPNEDRLSLLVRFQLLDPKTKKTILGPTTISSSVDYDYDPLINQDNQVNFSLGQFNFIEVAKSMAFKPLYHQISQKIAESIKNTW